MKKENEKEVKQFFFVIANNPMLYSSSYQSILNMTEPYIKSLKEIPKTSKYYHYSRGIIEGLYLKTGRAKTGQLHFMRLKDDDYKPGISYYEEKELLAFCMRRHEFTKILEKIASGVLLSEIEGLDTISIKAGIEFHSATYFEVSGGKMKPVEYTSGADVTSNKIGEYKELLGISRLGFLSLILFLAEEGQGHIKKCPYCERFFHARDTKRKICYESKCSKEYHKKDMQLRREKDPVRYC